MANAPIRRRGYTIPPASFSLTTTTTIQTPISLKKGDRIVYGDIQKLILCDQADTLLVQTDAGAGTLSLLAATDLSAGAVGDIIDMQAASIKAGGAGALCTGAGTITATWNVPTTATILPSVRITLGIVHHENIS